MAHSLDKRNHMTGNVGSDCHKLALCERDTIKFLENNRNEFVKALLFVTSALRMTGGGCPVLTFCGQGRVLQMRTSALFDAKKLRIFLNL